jgi:hypothetical protein
MAMWLVLVFPTPWDMADIGNSAGDVDPNGINHVGTKT